ncbi:MAG: HD domain-containing protein [Acholeplasmatales bacterium]|jgi:HD superfamily phosphohydrolase|nr:HD domain-containing protein [Acholeplasmatales bacterium]
MNSLQRQVVFKDPIYGYIHVNYEFIKKLIDTPLFQRLRRIRQLSGVVMVFHGAEHSRFSHSLGAYELANRFLEIIDVKNTFTFRESLLFITSALLHDIGHGAYSHAFEDVFGVNHEHIGAEIIVSNKEIVDILDTIDEDFASDIKSIILKTHKFPIIEQFISSQLDVDRMDYLERDAYFTGTAYGHIDIDRIIRVLFIKESKVVFKSNGIHAIENYLISRYHMYWQVYYHPVARAYEAVLEKIYLRVKDLIALNFHFDCDIDALKKIIINPNDICAYTEIDDYYINGLIRYFIKSDDYYLKTLSLDFLNRNIWKRIDNVEENKEKINEILNTLDDEEKRYFTCTRTVSQGTYRDEGEKLGENIYILLEDGTISTIRKESKIIESLMYSGVKSDPKFFYRKKNET